MIEGMRPREDWQDPAKPVKGPAPRGQARTWVIHYPAGNAEPVGDQVAPYLRQIQSSYLNSRGYSIGYSWGVAQDGSKWEIRGDDFNPASNPGKKVEGNFNNVSRSIFVMVKGDDPASPATVEAINEIIATHPDWDVITHGDVDYTACCGKGMIGQVRSGVIGAAPSPAPTSIYAGVDVEAGVNYNSNAWVVPGGGAGLRLEDDGTLRSVQLRNGKVTGIENPMSYNRPHTAATFEVPFEVSGSIFLHSRASDVYIYGESRHPGWTWAPSFHPVFVDEDNNIVTSLSPKANRWSASGQQDGRYGIARDELFVAEMNHDAQLGAWHRWRMVVPEVGTHEVYWDDQLVYRVRERPPFASWWGRPMHAGIRLDFYDYSLKFGDTPPPPPSESELPDMMILDLNPGTDWWVAMVLDANSISHIVNGNHVAVLERGGVPRVQLNETELDGVLLSVQALNESPFQPGMPAHNDNLNARWNAALS